MEISDHGHAIRNIDNFDPLDDNSRDA